ncbi:muscle, skeletal receptor tyrosine protein kinase isoform X1 [Apis mellifera caucasica]|uniref:Muscle, skeletal receptor tyrosine protein kinase isoform X1 n=1 Tax=Apis mellifera TaxID=7460 RepID=A0A7M7GT32_APIME|nr:muscle, skeletal receptor tyrosine protein kinase isoform X1 [Apis mellifera]KAG6804029.1 muscle, skeletal receptor tyrosine protein kinase isoform X1 [Apis mellifera caucasica]KAG9437046.1 muscle, skeletal receptor tyrosine protein kinase isoform X1 [Apis mellifera carnica]|eukprot:XP_006562017.1 muscle, skeletal receptor tyrosine protein kinase isoform X1 [Apis mellifera]
MERRRTPRRRGLSSAEIRQELSVNASTQQSEVIARLLPINGNPEITGCKDRPHICGKEAACRSFKDNTSKCVCPHDLSPPTTDLKCPNRLIVPLTPRPIPNIIPPNGNSTNSTTALPEAEQYFHTVQQAERVRQKVPEIIGITIAFVAVLAILLSIVYCVKKRSYNVKSQRNSLDGTPMNLKKGLLLANKYTPNPQYFSCASPEVSILQRESLAFLQEIGEGCFGKVYKGELCIGDSKEIVAIKVLKETAPREAEEDFMREVDIMSTFGHRNILSLKGAVLREGNSSPWMVFEYMPYGDLAEVLRSNSRQFNRSPKPEMQPLTEESLHWITIQIAAGMTYLSGQRFVHRDLACRNCLVGYDFIVKIADFGMSRDVYTCDYYKIKGSRLLPIRWMSPESVMYGRFTLESDVWSFGVVLWEVYSFGKQPYYGHNNEEVVKLIFQGIMLIPPEGCPPFVCQIMRECWKTDPKDRIKFPEILERLEKVKVKTIQDTLPRPPQGPVTIRTPDVLDPDGYLLPAPAKPHEYLQTLPSLSD